MFFWVALSIIVGLSIATGLVIRRDYRASGSVSTTAVALEWTVYIGFGAVVIGGAWTNPWGKFPVSAVIAHLTGAFVCGMGTTVVIDAMATFRSLERISGTEIDKLVTEGIYRYSRNPQIFGSGLALVGVAVAGRSAIALGGVVVFMVLSHIYLLWLEEPQLEETFGEAYREYRARTPRYLGLPAERDLT